MVEERVRIAIEVASRNSMEVTMSANSRAEPRSENSRPEVSAISDARLSARTDVGHRGARDHDSVGVAAPAKGHPSALPPLKRCFPIRSRTSAIFGPSPKVAQIGEKSV